MIYYNNKRENTKNKDKISIWLKKGTKINMKKNIKIVTFLLIINIIFNLFIYSVNGVNQTVSNDINSIDTSKYPGIKEKIDNLKNEHPNWNFKILYTGIDWNEAIAYQYTGHGSSPKNLVPDSSSYRGDWVCSYCGNKAYDSGSWRCASLSAIKYMMDPRASLNSSDVFQFLELSYNEQSGYSRDVLKQMVSGSFLDKDSYIDKIMSACKNSKVNPYYIVARILQEQGKSGSTLTKGQGYNGQYVGYYNVFNIGATGSNKDKVILNGLAKAKSYGWTSMELSLEGGIKVISSSYIAVGQNTLYFQKFDVENSDGKLYWHQYMQNILAAQNEGTTLRKTFTDINAINNAYTFVIPVYENMPVNTTQRPSATSSSGVIDVELVKINVTSSIKMRNEPNGSQIKGYLYKDEIATRLEKATEKVNGTYWDKLLKSDGTVGYVARTTYDYEGTYKEYIVWVAGSASSGNQNNENSNNTNPPVNSGNEGNTTKGDVNGDGKITAGDYVLIKNSIMGTYNLKDNQRNSADYNGDGKITSGDYVLVKNKIMQD